MVSQHNSMPFLEDLTFLVLATAFLILAGWAWRKTKPFTLPEPLPSWFRVWFLVVILVGLVLPFISMVVWGIVWDYNSVLPIFISYFVMLALQILSERITLQQFHSCIWIAIPCLYVPYRIWQLYRSFTILDATSELVWVQRILIIEMALWIFNYGVHLSQIPRLLRWDVDSLEQPESH
jgi:hypothetical protein